MHKSLLGSINKKRDLRPQASAARIEAVIVAEGITTRAELDARFTGVGPVVGDLCFDGQLKVFSIPLGCNSHDDPAIKYSIGDIA